MPIHQEISQVNRAKNHIKWLKERYKNVYSLNIDLSKTYDYFKKNTINDIQSNNYQMALVNSRDKTKNDDPILLCSNQ